MMVGSLIATAGSDPSLTDWAQVVAAAFAVATAVGVPLTAYRRLEAESGLAVIPTAGPTQSAS